VALRLPVAAEVERLGEPAHHPSLRVDRKSGTIEPLHRRRLRGGELGRQRSPVARGLHLSHLVGPERKRTSGGDGRVLLAKRTRRRVARVDEEPLSRIVLATIEVFERGDRHVDLAPHLHDRGRRPDLLGELLRYRTDRGHVGRHVLAGPAVAAGCCLDKPPLVVAEGDGQAVDLQLADELGVRGDLLGQPVRPSLELFGSEGVVEAHHRHSMGHRGEEHRRRSADRRGRRTRDHQVGVIGFDRCELADQGVVFDVGDLGVVEPVVAVVVVRDELSQLLGPRDRIVARSWRIVARWFAHAAMPDPTTRSGSSRS
jgi:hypothetical protein